MPSKEDLTNYFKGLSQIELSQVLIREINQDNPSLDFIKFLVSLGACLDNSKNVYKSFFLPLHLAAAKGHLSVLKLLIELGADTYEDVLFEGTPLHTAAKHGQLKIIKYLLSLVDNINIDGKGLSSATPLHLASKNGHLRVVEFLLDAGANINSDSTYSTPIFWAVIGNQTSVVELLIKRGANLDVIYYGFDGYGGENQDLINAALTRSINISMGHEVTTESRKIVNLIKKAKSQQKTKS